MKESYKMNKQNSILEIATKTRLIHSSKFNSNRQTT